jgi:hypothetical protein
MAFPLLQTTPLPDIMDLMSPIATLASIKERFTIFTILLIIFSLILRSIYRLYLHPLHHIPGPKLAAISHAYEFYHDVIRGGLFVWEIEKMHEKYGSA